MGKVSLKCLDVKPLEGNTIAPPLELDKIYDLVETLKCECGQLHYNVGLESKFNYVRCYACERELIDSGPGKIHWCHPKRFLTLVTQE